jgi:L-iditol 2-dehydrogenase/threonine 3-dehydrogenase
MRQVVLTAPKSIEFREVEAPKAEALGAHEILLHIQKIGICGSEIHSYHGLHPATFYPVVQGHEYSAIVTAVGSEVTKVKPGDHVTGRPQRVCGVCNPCRRGQYNVCSELKVEAFQANGVAQDYFVLPDDRVVLLPEGMSLEYGAMVEPTAVAAHATSRPRALKGLNVVVSGAGTIGNLIAQFAIARGARKVVITDVSDYRLNKAKECGVADTLNVAHESLDSKLHDLFGDEGYQVAFECAGVESSVRSLMATVEKGGDVIIVGVHAKDPAISMFHLGEHELNLIGSMMYRHEDYLKAVEEISAGRIHLEPLISNRFPLEQYREAYEFIDANRETCMKVLIDLHNEEA